MIHFPKALGQAATHRDMGICPDYVLIDMITVLEISKHIVLSNYILKELPALADDPYLCIE